MKQVILASAFFLMCQFSFAQYDDFDLSKYKLPDIKRHQLDFNFSFDNTFREHRYESTDDRSYFDLNNDLSLNYSYYRNTMKKQSDGWGNISSNITLDHEKQEAYNRVKDDYYNFKIDAGFLKRIYTNSDDRWFLLWSTNLYVSHILYRKNDLWSYDNNLTEKHRSRFLTLQPGVSLGGGFGRVERVGDARRAIYIIDDLYKNNKLKRLPDENELLVIANKVAELRNQRFFDARLRHIYEMESLDSLLNTMDLVSNNDMGYFTALNDMWLYGDESRRSGTRLQAQVGGQLYYRFIKRKTEGYDVDYSDLIIDDNDNVYNETLRLRLELDSYKPIGLKWQRYLSVQFLANRYFNDIDETEVSDDYYYFVGSINYGYYWYLNTRTYASFGVRGNSVSRKYIEDQDYYSDRKDFQAGISGSLNYYFSPRLKASVQMNAYCDWDENDDSSYNRYFAIITQASLNYAIF